MFNEARMGSAKVPKEAMSLVGFPMMIELVWTSFV